MLFQIYGKISALHRQTSTGASATAYIKRNKFQPFILSFFNLVCFVRFFLIKRLMHVHYNKSKSKCESSVFPPSDDVQYDQDGDILPLCLCLET